jgi:hypothetical protein
MNKILSYDNWKGRRKKNIKNSIRLALSKLFFKCKKTVKRVEIVLTFIIIKYPIIKKLPSTIYSIIIKIIIFIRKKSIYIGGILCVFGIYSLCRRFFPLIEAQIIRCFPEQTNKVFQALAQSELEIAEKKKVATKIVKDAAMSDVDHVRSRYWWLIRNVGPYYVHIMITLILSRRST